MFSKIQMPKSIDGFSTRIALLRDKLNEADAVIIGAGSGLSTSAGLTYSGARFERLFSDFIQKYSISDLYSGGFFPFESPEEYWAWWSRHIYWNRYVDAPGSAYRDLLTVVKNKNYFVLTTNVDHQFQRAGFTKERLFYTQGDYGLFQCSIPCCRKTYDNETVIRQMIDEQKNMRVPSELVPRCPVCDEPLTVNLRCDDLFVEDEGWYRAAERYKEFLSRYKGERILFLELGVGRNTPVIIKYPFWRLTQENPKAVYACINSGEAFAPVEIEKQSICIDGDIGETIHKLCFAE